VIALLGYHDDQDLSRLEEAFIASGQHVTFFKFGLHSRAYSSRWHSATGPELRSGGLLLGASELDRADCIISKWWRMDDYPLVRCDIGSADENRFAEREWNALIVSSLKVWESAYQKKWIGQSQGCMSPDLKVFYLQEATRAGLAVPPFCVGTIFEPPLPGSEIIGKALNKNESIDGERYFRTTKLNGSNLERLQGLRAECPSFLQQFIDRTQEQRVVVCGTEAFTVNLLTRENHVDIRFVGDLRTTLSREPRIEAELAIDLCRTLGLSLCTLDFVVDGAGTAWLVDVTPNGSWSWLEGGDRTVTERVVESLARQFLNDGD
jgi:hypothetical protein